MNASHRRSRRLRGALAGLAAAALGLTGCASEGGEGVSSSSKTIDYWLWDTNQLPAYQRCADLFEESHPGLSVNITQYGWDDYWQLLTAGFIAERGPDVFTNHVSQYPQYVSLETVQPLDELEATAAVDEGEFQEGLSELWTGEGGRMYGMPKDWDTVAAFYNKDMVREAGLTEEDLATWDWNPRDGGGFEDVIARLTVDENGVRGDEPGFDKSKVEVYGLGLNEAGGSSFGQAQWSGFAAATGWRATDEPFWDTSYNFDDPRAQEALDWYFGLVDKGYMPAYGQFNQADGVAPQIASGSAAIAFDGSWSLRSYARSDLDLGTARYPTGPDGQAASMMNGLADSISRDADDPEAAAQWVAFMASPECQQAVARDGVVFPSRQDSTPLAAEAFAQMGLDPEPFTAPVEEDEVFYFPVTDHGADVRALAIPALEDIYANRAPASTLDRTNRAIDVLFETGEG
ncbi:sugar ABC transporter substrate-binding protein [Rothia sp. AR01]|uniref:Sugar ABC transporter substrate-binding protein n=1 Tax=Rothia santali TaxID=2949643 RepID=A0A9X2HEK2_9MICC|nr:sugar ABC transporter substrate-binding protein [Rothia santali]MCP3425387.1 sugar ABC transporter substrate-binding protein [Rothia santali]